MNQTLIALMLIPFSTVVLAQKNNTPTYATANRPSIQSGTIVDNYKPNKSMSLSLDIRNNEPENKKLRLDRGPFVYITTSTGVNNNTAILGFSLDVPLSSKITLDGGVGTGTWNYKFYLGAKYYLKPAQRGFAFGGGITYANGTRGNEYYIVTVYNESTYEKFNKNPQTNIFLSAYKYWSLGKRYNRFYSQLGWSLPISGGEKITQLTGNPVSIESKNRISSHAPGGLIVAIGFSFGIH